MFVTCRQSSLKGRVYSL